MGDKTRGEAGAADGENWLRVFSKIPNQPTCLLKHAHVNAIKKNCCCAAARLAVKVFSSLKGVKSSNVDATDGKICLTG
jgi:hypothetical protein